MPNFAEILRKIRLEHSQSQKELADVLNVTQTAITYWETGKREPSIEILRKIANYYGVSMDYLMGLEENLCEMTIFEDEIDDYTQELGEFLYYNPEHRVLFDASMEVSPQDVNFAKEMLDRINGKISHESDNPPQEETDT